MFDVRRSSWTLSVLMAGSLLLGAVGGGSIPAQAQTSITGERKPCENKQAAGQYPCQNVDLMSYLSIPALGGGSEVALNDIWGWTDSDTGRRYAIVGRTDGTAFVDVTNPTEPVYLGELPTHSSSSSWRDVKVYEDHAFIVSEASNHGMQVFDLTQLRSVSNPPVTFSETAQYDRFSTAHNIVINRESGFAYGVGLTGSQDVPNPTECGAGLHIVDIRTPDQPTFAGCHNDLATGGRVAGYTHDAQCVMYRGPDAEYHGREVCFNANEKQVNIADVSDKDNPETIANGTYPQPGYVHQAWLTENQEYLLVDDELDEVQGSAPRTRTLVFDVSDLDNPELVQSYLGKTGSSDHNQYVLGDYSYQANYKSGLRILDVSDPESLSEVAYFDTHPPSNDAGFQGAWSNYPFFRNGVVIVSSIGEGLFVLAPTVSPITYVDAHQQEGNAVITWGLSVAFDTRRTELEHKTPTSETWENEGTLSPQQGGGPSSTTFEKEVGNLDPGTHAFRVRHISDQGKTTVNEPVRVRVPPEEDFFVKGPAPNPVQGRATLRLIPSEREQVTVDLYDSLGRHLATLQEGTIPAGADRTLEIRGDQHGSGVYFLRIQSETLNTTKKVVVAR